MDFETKSRLYAIAHLLPAVSENTLLAYLGEATAAVISTKEEDGWFRLMNLLVGAASVGAKTKLVWRHTPDPEGAVFVNIDGTLSGDLPFEPGKREFFSGVWSATGLANQLAYAVDILQRQLGGSQAARCCLAKRVFAVGGWDGRDEVKIYEVLNAARSLPVFLSSIHEDGMLDINLQRADVTFLFSEASEGGIRVYGEINVKEG